MGESIRMQLALDATPILPGRKGLGLFLEHVIDHLDENGFSNSPLIYVDRTYLSEAKKRWPSLKFCPVFSNPSSIWEEYELPLRVRKDRVSVLFTGRDRTYLEPHCRTFVYLFEVPDHRYDAILNGNASWYDKISIRISRKRFRRVVQSVTRFIVSSCWTQNDLELRYGVSRNRIATVYPGVDPAFQPAGDHATHLQARKQFANGKKYVLHFATGDVRDNTEVAFSAFQNAVPFIPADVKLLLAGASQNSLRHWSEKIRKYGLIDRVCTVGFLSGDDLVMAYQGAEVYFDPTRYEGFGFQNLEAMACAVPVISSSVSSVPEVVGQAGLLFSPEDISGFSGALQEVLTNPKLSEGLKQKGLERAKQFTWARSMKQIFSVIQ